MCDRNTAYINDGCPKIAVQTVSYCPNSQFTYSKTILFDLNNTEGDGVLITGC